MMIRNWSKYALIGLMMFWGPALVAQNLIDRAEYFIDDDPGIGNGEAVSITAAGNLDEQLSIDVSGLRIGNHTLYVRTKVDNGSWSLSRAIPFFVQDTTALVSVSEQRAIVAAEYFVDEDPGVGNANQLPLTVLSELESGFSVPSAGLANGAHTLYLRLKDNTGVWSIASTLDFAVLPSDGNIPLPFFAADTVALGATTTFTNRSDSVDANTTYTWDVFDDGTVDFTTENITFAFDTTGLLPVRLTAFNGTDSASYLGQVIVGDFENLEITQSGSLDLCEGEEVTLTAPDGYSIYAWNTQNSTQSITVSESGNYFAWLTDANGLTIKSKTIAVNVTPSFEATVSVQNATNGQSNGFAEVFLVGDLNGSNTGLSQKLQEGLVAYYPFNGNANDESGNGYNGTVNGPVLTQDRFGNLNAAYRLDGIEDNIFIESPDLQLSSAITLSAWVKIEETTNDHQVLISKWYNGNTQVRSFVFELQPNGEFIQFPIEGVSTDNISNATATEAISFGEWVHLVGRFDGSSLALFIDGVKTNEFAFSGTIQQGATNLVLGAHEATNDRNTIKGDLDDVLIYNRALTDQEVTQLYNIGSEPIRISQNDFTTTWSTGSVASFVKELAPGSYSVEVSSGSCSQTIEFTIANQTIATSGEASPSAIVAAEYFIDADPGTGNGTAMNVSNGTTVEFQETIDLDGVAVGNHSLYIRTLANNGVWSLARQMPFFVKDTTINDVSSIEENIVAAEVFIDDDPGVGKGSPINVANPTKGLTGGISISPDTLSTGGHTLYVRTKSDLGNWSIAAELDFQVCGLLPPVPTVADIVACPGETITLTATGSSNATYRWFASDSTLIEGQVGNTYTIGQVGEDMTYYVAQVDASGCQSNLAEINITAPMFDVFAGLDLRISKAGMDYQLADFYPSNEMSGVWSGSGVTEEGIIGRTINAGTYTLTYSVDTLGCTFSDTRMVEVVDLNQSLAVTVAENIARGTILETIIIDEDVQSYEAVSGEVAAISIVQNGTITVADSSFYDFELNPTLSWVIHANVSPEITYEINLEISLTNEQDPPIIADQSFTLDENSPNGTVVGTIVATDQDSPTLAYSIVSGNGSGTFELINSNELSILDSTALDYETQQLFELMVAVTDGFETANAMVTIELNDVEEIENTAPIILNQEFSVDENSLSETVIGTLVATDAVGDELTFSILAGNELGTFAIEPSTGILTVANNSTLDFETNPTFSLTVEVSDGALSATAIITINLNNIDESVNIAPSIADQTFTIDENSAVGTVIGTIVATDPDEDALTYSLDAGNTSDAFAINASTGELTVANDVLDFETLSSYSLTVSVSDTALSVSATITVTINDVDESVNQSPQINAQTFSIDENSAVGTVIGTIVATDPDEDALTYSLDAGNTSNAFAINVSTGELTVANDVLDFETQSSYSLTVSVSDTALSVSATITVTINDVDESVNQSPQINAQTFSIDENSAVGSVIGIVVATDPDEDALTYTLDAGNTSNAFAINVSTGELTVANDVLDFETQSSYSLTVSVSDTALSASATITVTINDIDESVNQFPQINAQTFLIDENSAVGSVVGTVVASDPDEDALTYTLTAGNDAGGFALSASTGILTVSDATVLDFETTPSFSLTVEVSDGALSVTATITVNLTDIAENQSPTIADQTFEIAENSAQGTQVGTVVASDPDGDAWTYTLTAGNDAGGFALDASTGILSVSDATVLDFETTPSFSLTVEVSDGALSATATVTVSLTDVAENQSPTIADQIFEIAENSPQGTQVGTVVASDPDGDALTYSLTAGNDAGGFALSASTGILTVSDATVLDFETTQSFGLTVQVSDGALSATATITVNLTDADEEVLGLEALGIQIYPNPTRGNIFISYQQGVELIGLTDISGKQVPYSILSNEKGQLNVELLSKDQGVYFIHLMLDNERKAVKVFKE